MTTQTTGIYTIEELAQLVAPIAKAYGMKAVYLFGSYARGTATAESDIDLIVDTDGTTLTNLFALGQLYCDLESALGKKIDLLTVRSLEQPTKLPSEDLFRSQVEQERRMLYAVA
ncbi:nucleotidyltransferase domain-containing protein [Bengtsoniella intestinalis]|uniref:nucleotidyltransferase family protein n=1 Tax=Bengtsoniella intestinalis TaxID=3073143 RepID=UPI00391FB6B9